MTYRENHRLGAYVEPSAEGERAPEPTGRSRGRIYAYSDYLALLDRGTDTPPA